MLLLLFLALAFTLIFVDPSLNRPDSDPTLKKNWARFKKKLDPVPTRNFFSLSILPEKKWLKNSKCLKYSYSFSELWSINIEQKSRGILYPDPIVETGVSTLQKNGIRV